MVWYDVRWLGLRNSWLTSKNPIPTSEKARRYNNEPEMQRRKYSLTERRPANIIANSEIGQGYIDWHFAIPCMILYDLQYVFVNLEKLV